jgi:hypothetical protein
MRSIDIDSVRASVEKARTDESAVQMDAGLSQFGGTVKLPNGQEVTLESDLTAEFPYTVGCFKGTKAVQGPLSGGTGDAGMMGGQQLPPPPGGGLPPPP